MKEKRSSLPFGCAAVVILLALDQATKYLAQTVLRGTRGVALIPGVFELLYLENRGAAFGMFANRQWFFILVALIMTAAACYVYCCLPASRRYLPLRLVCILVAAGALGNMADRLLWNYVIDFLYFSLIDFPVFNVADCYVCIGCVLAVLLIFTKYRDDSFAFLLPGKKTEKE